MDEKMNKELIKQLAKEAQKAIDARWEKEGYPPYPEAHRIFIEERDIKLAELIVEECMQVINGDIIYQYNKGIITNLGGLNQARFLISHQFGVELTEESVPLRR